MNYYKSQYTYVTAFVDIRSYENNTNTHLYGSLDLYKRNAKLLLQHDVNFICFVDSCLVEWVKKIRKDKICKTFIMETNVEDLSTFKYYERAKFLHDNEKTCLGKNRNKYTALYYLCIYNKTYWMRDAIQMNPFDSDYFVWMDFRIKSFYPNDYKCCKSELDGINNFDKIIESRKENLHLMLMDHVKSIGPSNPENFYRNAQGKVSAQIFYGHKDYIMKFHEFCEKEIEKCIFTYDCLTTEQNIYAIFYQKHQDIIDFHIGDYGEALGHLGGNFSTQWKTYNGSLIGAIDEENVDVAEYIIVIGLNTLKHMKFDISSQKRYIDQMNKLFSASYNILPEEKYKKLVADLISMYRTAINFNLYFFKDHKEQILYDTELLNHDLHEEYLNYLDFC